MSCENRMFAYIDATLHSYMHWFPGLEVSLTCRQEFAPLAREINGATVRHGQRICYAADVSL